MKKFLFCLAILSWQLALVSCQKKEKNVRFAIVSDFHAQDVPDGEQRVAAFIDAAMEDHVDFIIQLGDFCRLDSAGQAIRAIWEQFPGDKYHVIGNHDMDSYDVETFTKGFGMPGRYYSFDKGNYHFIVLDGNNLYDGEKYTHYAKANYYVDSRYRAFIDPEQMEWLKNDLTSTDKRCILFSHQSLDRAVGNKEAVRQLLEEENRRAGFRKVAVAFSGHDHSNYAKEINGITYIQINSASYVWIDKPSETEKRYPADINEKYPLLTYSITYDKPLFGIVTADEDGLCMKGTDGRFMPPTPEDMQMPDSLGVLPLVSDIKDVHLKYE